MRPRGEVRVALTAAAHALAVEREHFTHRDLAERAQVGYSVARITVNDMADAGELARTGHAKSAGGRWMTMFTLQQSNFATSATSSDLDRVFRAWRA